MEFEMSERAKEARREYKRRWRQAHREQTAFYEAKFFERFADFLEAEAKTNAESTAINKYKKRFMICLLVIYSLI